jgi:hypothetical protein
MGIQRHCKIRYYLAGFKPNKPRRKSETGARYCRHPNGGLRIRDVVAADLKK